MNNYILGNRIIVTGTFTNRENQPVDPESVVARIIDPAGEETTLSYPGSSVIERAAAGVYTFPILLDREGTWRYRMECAGDETAAEGAVFVPKSPFAA